MTRVSSLLVLAVLAAACGGSSKPAAQAPEPAPAGGRMAAPGEVVGDATVLATLEASTIPLPAGTQANMRCEPLDAPTLGAQITAWKTSLGGPISASCDEGACRVEITSKRDPACDTGGASGEDCEGFTWLIEYTVDVAGAIEPDSLMCMGAG